MKNLQNSLKFLEKCCIFYNNMYISPFGGQRFGSCRHRGAPHKRSNLAGYGFVRSGGIYTTNELQYSGLSNHYWSVSTSSTSGAKAEVTNINAKNVGLDSAFVRNDAFPLRCLSTTAVGTQSTQLYIQYT